MRASHPMVAAQLEELASWLAEGPIAIDPEWLVRMMAANSGSRREVEGFFFFFDEKQPLAYSLQDGVARIPIRGPIAKRSYYRVTYDEIAGTVEKAANDGRVRGILLDVDSPGGVINGMYEAAAAVKAAAQKRPVWAVANDYMTSAAYGVASGASKIVASRYATVGSIGVVLAHFDYSKQNEQRGVKPTFIVGGRKKVWGNPEEPLGEDAHKDLQKTVDHHYTTFAQLVAGHRGMELADVLGQEAGVFLPDQARKERLVDGLMSFDEAQSALSAEVRRTAMSDHKEDERDPKGGSNVVDLDAARAEAKAEARREAQTRAEDIERLCQLAGKPELAGKFIKDEKMDAAKVGDALLELRAKEDERHRTSGVHGDGTKQPEKSLATAMVERIKARGDEPRRPLGAL